MGDTVPDVPPPTPTQPAPKSEPSGSKPLVSGPNSFFLWLMAIFFYMLFHSIAWQALQYVVGSKLGKNTMYLLLLWLIPIIGILTSIVVPSLGTTSAWLVGSSVASGITIFVVMVYVLLYGIRTDPPASA